MLKFSHMVLQSVLLLYVSQKCGTQNFNDQTNGYSNGLFSSDCTLGHICFWNNNTKPNVSESTAQCKTS